METTNKAAKHFEFTGETKELDTDITLITLHRIRATVKTMHANIGDIGGWVEKPDNLCDNAWVSDNAIVCGNACVFGNAQVYGEAEVYDNACVFGYAQVYGEAEVYDNACVFGNAQVYGEAEVCDNACVFGNAQVYGNASVNDNASVYDDANVYDYANVYDNASVYDNAILCDMARVYDRAIISGNACVYGKAKVSGNANIKSHNDHCGFDYLRPIGRHAYAYRTTEGVEITNYDFRGSIDEFAAKLKETYCGSENEKQYELIIRLIKLKFNLPD